MFEHREIKMQSIGPLYLLYASTVLVIDVLEFWGRVHDIWIISQPLTLTTVGLQATERRFFDEI
jgi:hypothetical protein